MAGIYKRKEAFKCLNKKTVFLLSLFSLVALIAACTNQPQKKQFQQKEEITLAAASLESVMEKKIIPAFEKSIQIFR